MAAENNPTPVRPDAPPTNPKLAETALTMPDTSANAPHAPRAHIQPEDWVGKALGKYQIISVLGQGGMGVVLKARDPMIEREVAVKVLASHLASDELALGRFLAEARAAGKVNHPNVIAIHEICQEGRIHFLVLEYVPGGSLDERVEKLGALSVLEATQAMIDACKGVGAAHSAGLIHRDLKPGNLMRAADGSIKVADFGLAKSASDANRHFTQTGMIVGTPFFMSPEQCEAKTLDRRSDVYSLGATYFSLLTGKAPYHDTDSVVQLMYLHCNGPIPDPRSVIPAIPEVCQHIVAKAMAKAPADRYQTASEMLADLEAVAAALSGSLRVALPSQSGTMRASPAAAPVHLASSRRIPVVLACFMILALVGLTAFMWHQSNRDRGQHQPGGIVPPSGPPIKIGVLHSLTGTMASSEAVVVDALMFAIAEVNQAGGVMGRPVEAQVVDGRSDPAAFASGARKLIEQDKVCTVFGCWTSASRKTVKPVFEEHDHLLVYPLQYEGLETSPCIVYLGAAPNQQILPAVEWAVNTMGKKRFFLVGSDYVFPRAAHAIIKHNLKVLGAELAGEEYLLMGSQMVDGVIKAIVDSKADMILNTINGDSNIAFFRTLRAAGVKSAETPTMSFSISEQGLRSLNPKNLEGDYAAWTYFQSVATPENEEFVRRFAAKYPQHSITDPMETAYIGLKMWANAVNEAQCLEPKKIRRALLNQSFKGPGGEVRIDADNQHCVRTPRIGQIQPDGQFKVVWTAPAPVRPDPYPGPRTAEEWRAFLHDLYTGWGNSWTAPDKQR